MFLSSPSTQRQISRTRQRTQCKEWFFNTCPGVFKGNAFRSSSIYKSMGVDWVRQVRHASNQYFMLVGHAAPVKSVDKILRKCLKKETKTVLKTPWNARNCTIYFSFFFPNPSSVALRLQSSISPHQ